MQIMKTHNFSAGPCILPQEVFKEASESLINFDNLGLSVIEISHRSKSFVAVMDEAVALVKDQLQVPDTHEVSVFTRRCFDAVCNARVQLFE
jgi:phosphoserine aminotransferase